jgi:hypothetical protein
LKQQPMSFRTRFDCVLGIALNYGLESPLY